MRPHTASVDAPYPPLSLAQRVCCLEGHDAPLQAYERLGAEAKSALVGLLPDDWSFAGKRVLDFGCGAGRTLRHFLAEAQDAEFWGADIDAASIAWLRDELSPPLHVVQSKPAPPLGLEYGTFDLVWALSVFTHLTDESIPWLLELHRLLRPGGLLVATYMGRWNGEIFTHEPWDEDRTGMNVLRRDAPWEQGGPAVLMSDWWIREHWGCAYEIVDVAPQVHGQTWPLLRKRDVQVTVEDVERLSDDPRELSALRHNVRQAEREGAAMASEVRRYYEESRSWRLTRPMRRSTILARKLRERLAPFSRR